MSDVVNEATLFSAEPAQIWSLDQPTRSGLAWMPVSVLNDPEAVAWLAYADGSTVQLVDTETGEARVIFSNEDDYLPGTLAFSAEGSVLAVMNRAVDDTPTPRTLKLFDATTGELLFTETLDSARVMAFSPDGSLIAVLTDDSLRLYGVATLQDAVG